MEPNDLKPIEEGISKVLDAQGKLAGAVEESKTKLASLEAKAASTEQWMAEIERKLAAKRQGFVHGDNLREVIGQRDLRYLRGAEIVAAQNKSAQERTGRAHGIFNDDPVLKLATGVYIRNLLYGLVSPEKYRAVAEQQDKLRGLMSVEKVALDEAVAAEGGNLVPTVVEAEILRLIADNSVMRPLVRKVPMTTKTHAFPTRAAAFSANIIAEAGAITDSVPANPFSQSNLTAKKLAAFATISMELLQDNVVALGDYLATEFAEQIGRLEDTQSLEGDGTGVNFTGITAAAGVNSISSGANGEFLLWSLMINTIYQAAEESSRAGAAFFCHPSALGAIYKARWSSITAADAAGGLLVMLPNFVPGRPTPALMGYPIFTHSGILANRAIGTGTNRTQVYFGPPQTIIFGDLLGFQIDLNPWSKFNTAQIDVRGLKRTGILVGVPGAWTQYQRLDASGPMR